MSVPWDPIISGVFLAVISAAVCVFFRRISAAMDRHRDAVTEAIESKFASLEKGHKEQDKHIADISEQLKEIEIRLPEQYVRQTDMQREMARIHMSIQAMHDKFDRYIMGGIK